MIALKLKISLKVLKCVVNEESRILNIIFFKNLCSNSYNLS